MDQGEQAVVACSAREAGYRDILADGRSEVRVVHLKGSMDLICRRLGKRVHRYMPASLLQSQFETLEEPRDALVVDITPAPEAIVREIRQRLSI